MNTAFDAVQLSKPKLLHEQVYEQVRARIRSGELKPGERLPSTHDLAERLQTHIQTIHVALTRLTREGLLVRIPNKGTYVAERTARLTCVGVYASTASFGGSLFERALQAMLREELAAAGIEMDVWLDPRPPAEVGEPWKPMVDAATNHEFQGVIATSVDVPRLTWLSKLPVPTAYPGIGQGPNSVYIDLSQFIELSLQALAEQGCRSVGLILPADPGFRHPAEDRSLWSELVEYFLAVCQQRGLVLKNEWMRLEKIIPNVPRQHQEQFGYEQFRQLWRQAERPDGLVIFPDAVARGAITAMLEQQVRVPAELKLALHKNETVNLLCPMPATLLVSSERALARGLIAQVQKQFRGEPCRTIQVPFTVRRG